MHASHQNCIFLAGVAAPWGTRVLTYAECHFELLPHPRSAAGNIIALHLTIYLTSMHKALLAKTKRRKLVIAAWKTYLDTRGSADMAKRIRDWAQASSDNLAEYDLVISPTFLHIAHIRRILQDTAKVGAQNADIASMGAYTGHIPAELLSDAGCSYVLLGHSEMRKYRKETDAILQRKIRMILENSSMNVVLCIGEDYEQRSNGSTLQVLEAQIRRGLRSISEAKLQNRLSIAYEPVWAISSENPVRPPDAVKVNHTHKKIRRILNELFGKKLSDATRILYGGSVNLENVSDYIRQSDIDGVLVGSASSRPTFTNLLDVIHRALDNQH